MRLSSIDKMHAKAGGRSNFFFRYFLLFIVLIFCIFQLNIHKIYGFSTYPDEFGYWADAAVRMGYDWTAAASLGSYYSFGYSLILTPILCMFQDSVAAYRGAIAVNMLLQCGAAGMLWGIFRRFHLTDHSQERKMQVIFALGTGIFYPAWSFYVQMTLSEALLTFLYVFICYRLALFMEKPDLIGAVTLALSFPYLYFVHMRTVGVVIAAVFTLALYAWKNPVCRKMLAVGMVVSGIGVLFGLQIKNEVINNVYAAAAPELLVVNDYAGHIAKFGKLFSLQGMWQLFLSCAGKLYYLGIASFGLFYPALYACLKETAKMLHGFCRKPEESEEKESKGYISFFCLLSLLGQFLITAIATMNPGRLDGIAYGRYNEYLLPVFIGIGLIRLCESGHKLRVFLISVVISASLFGITFWNALHSGLTAMQGYFACGISYLSDDRSYSVRAEFIRAFLFGIFLMSFVMGCIYTGKRFGKYVSVLGLVLLMEVLLTFCLQRKYIWLFNDVDYYNLQIYEYMAACEAWDDMPVRYLYGGGLPYIDLIQFAMRDKKIEIFTLPEESGADYRKEDAVEQRGASAGEEEVLEKILPDKGFLIVDYGCRYLEEIEKRYQRCTESRAFILFLAE